MKKLLNATAIVWIAVMLLAAHDIDPECRTEILRLQQAGLAFTNADAAYMEYTVINSFDGKAEPPMKAKYWRQGDRMQFISDPVTIFSDGKTLVRIFEPIQVVAIQNIPQRDNGPQPPFDPQASIDSLLGTACAVSCTQSGNIGKIVFDFLPQRGVTLPYRSVLLHYGRQNGKVERAEYEYFPDQDGVVQRDTYVFHLQSNTVVKGMYPNGPIDQVMSGGKPTSQYKDYEFQDLRELAQSISK